MSSRSQRPLRRRISRRTGVLLACLTVAIATAVLPTTPAQAADGPFTIDGTVPGADGAIMLTDPAGSNKELGPKNGSPTKIGVIHNAATPMLELTNPNGQVDLNTAWLKTQREAGKDWLYFAWKRDSNTGSGFISFEFMTNPVPATCNYAAPNTLAATCNPWKNRQAGDFLILWDQQGSGTDLYKRVWSGTAPNLVLGPPVLLTAAQSQAQYSADGFRGEAAINLTDAVFGGSTACVSFANVIPSTVTGNSDSADYKDTILQTVPPITNCAATIVTTPKTGAGADIPVGGLSIGTGVAAVKDEATISLQGGTAAATGSINFFLCKLDVGTCSSGGTPVGATSIAGGNFPRTVSSPTAYVTSVGRYCWRAEWPGDVGNAIPEAKDSAATECFTVIPVTPTLTTEAGLDAIAGGTVSDTATLSGTATQPANPVINLTGVAGPAAGGTITFTLHESGANGCGDDVYTSTPVTVAGDDDYDTPNPQYAPDSVGTYHWVASYSGSSPNTLGTNHNTTCTDEAEEVDVLDVPSTLETAQSWVPNDSVTLTADAGGNMTGTVSFTLYASADCTGEEVFDEDIQINDPSGVTVSTSNDDAVPAGSYSWQVSYVSTNDAQRDIPASCEETSVLTVDDGDPVSSP